MWCVTTLPFQMTNGEQTVHYLLMLGQVRMKSKIGPSRSAPKNCTALRLGKCFNDSGRGPERFVVERKSLLSSFKFPIALLIVDEMSLELRSRTSGQSKAGGKRKVKNSCFVLNHKLDSIVFPLILT
jgi:hypothetical protein